MSTTISVRTDKETKQQAKILFKELGLNMSTAFNLFMKQALREQGIPFNVGVSYTNTAINTEAEAEHKSL